jgi:hypothetical protein
MRHAQPLVRRRLQRHAHLAAGLRAIDAGHVAVCQHAAPAAVGQDHHFRHQLVDRVAAHTRHDVDMFAIDLEHIVIALHLIRLAAHDFQMAGKTVQPFQFAPKWVTSPGWPIVASLNNGSSVSCRRLAAIRIESALVDRFWMA